MSSAVPQYNHNRRGGKTVPQPVWKEALPAVLIPWVQCLTCHMRSDGTSQCAMGQEEGSGFCSSDVAEAPSSQDGGVSSLLEVPVDPEKRTQRGHLGEWCALHAVCALVLAVLVVLVLALGVTVGVQSAGRQGGNRDVPAVVVLGCPEEWVGYRNVCYYLSEDEGGWEWSQEQCSSRGASMAVLKMWWEMEFISRLKGNVDCWVGLRRRGECLEWVDGSSFNTTNLVCGQEGCMFLNGIDLMSSSCSLVRPYLCSKPQALMWQR